MAHIKIIFNARGKNRNGPKFLQCKLQIIHEIIIEIPNREKKIQGSNKK